MSRNAVLAVAAIAAVAGLAWWLLRGESADRSRDAALIRELVTVEERILALGSQLAERSEALMDLQVPEGAEPELWAPLLAEVDWFEHARLYFVDGESPAGGATFVGKVGFSAAAKLKSGGWVGLKGKASVEWAKAADGDWAVSGWKTKSLERDLSPGRLFEQVLADALPREGDYDLVRRSVHQREAIKFYEAGGDVANQPHPYFAPISANQKPGIAVVDIDSDGDDDIYVTVRMGRNLLLENQGDGTFVEAAAKYGIHFTGHCTCALFADFDNDGDPDLFVGRSLRPSLYFENTGARFEAGTSLNEFPMLAITASAADYNGDGLLDLYLGTYRPATLDGASSPSGGDGGPVAGWPDHFYEPEMAAEYYRRHEAANAERDPDFPNLLDQIGPPNVLYVNEGGGRFKVSPASETVGVWRNTLQATWADYDEDGDPDLYVANDWAADHLFRNDGAGGFTDVIESSGATEFGFSMGASWGDYDGDGLQDLYVSNMFSKAGQRITARVPGIAEIYKESAAGNYLYRQTGGGKFELASGDGAPAAPVAHAGWSWGGQFADFDNDTWLDLYALSGYFTAPPPVSSELDL